MCDSVLLRTAGVPEPLKCTKFKKSLINPIVMYLACTTLGMTPEEALAGATINAAYSLNMSDRVGAITVGRQADIVVLNCDSSPALEKMFMWLATSSVDEIGGGFMEKLHCGMPHECSACFLIRKILSVVKHFGPFSTVITCLTDTFCTRLRTPKVVCVSCFYLVPLNEFILKCLRILSLKIVSVSGGILCTPCGFCFRWENIIYQFGEAESLITHVIKKGKLIFSQETGFVG
ncbi:hypothetical protein T265_13226, partial [Opisthorchis viverrini]